MEANGIAPIDLVVVNLYPFEETIAGGAERDEAVEQIDIGGPALIRAAAKNHAFVVVATDPEDYDGILRELEENDGGTTLDFRKCLAAAAYARTASYDAAISQWFARDVDIPFPRHIAFGGTRAEVLRYGENPHQEAAFYRALPERPGAASATPIQGKALSYNNIGDADAAFELVAEFDRPAIAIIKHANPCGVAVSDTLAEAYARAFACDPVSAFGGVVAANRGIDAAAARAITEIFVEVVIAPGIDEDALAVFAKKPNIRVLATGAVPETVAPGLAIRSIAGGMLVQDRDAASQDAADLRVVTKRAPHRPGTSRSPVCVHGRQARQVQRDRVRTGRGDRRHRRGSDEPGRFDPDRGPQGRRCRARGRRGGARDDGLGGRVGCVPAIRRRPDRRRRRGRDRNDPAGRLDPRRRGDRSRR